MPSDRTNLTNEHIALIGYGALADANWTNMRQRATPLDTPSEHPLYDTLLRQAKTETFSNGQTGSLVRGRYNQDDQAYSGPEILEYGFEKIGEKLLFYPGKTHQGLEIPLQVLQENGFGVDLASLERGVPSVSNMDDYARVASSLMGRGLMLDASDMNRAIDVFGLTIDGWTESAMLNLERNMAQAKGANPKRWQGWADILPTNNTTGTFGGKSRSDEKYRHYVNTGIASGDLEGAMDVALRETARFGGGGRKGIFCGELFMDALRSTFLTANPSTATKIDRRMTVGQISGEDLDGMRARFQIGIPVDSFYVRTRGSGQNVPIIEDLSFARLDEEFTEPIPFQKRCYIMDLDDIEPVFAPNLLMNGLTHQTPHNSEVLRMSVRSYGAIRFRRARTFAVLSVA